jgi:D-glycero-D-manno-heptose 1,7-bisphosphate phosphatase
MTGHPAVFLDRDGVINRAFVRRGRPYSPDRLEDLELLPGVAEAAVVVGDRWRDFTTIPSLF